MTFSPHRRKRTPTIIIVALIDVLIVVLIFLMVTTTTKKNQPVLKLTLPEARQAETGAHENPPLVVTVATNFPYFFIEDKAVTYDSLQASLAAATRTNAQLRVAIRADKHSPFGEIVKVIDAAKASRAAAINFFTEKVVQP